LSIATIKNKSIRKKATTAMKLAGFLSSLGIPVKFGCKKFA
jgi:hypothetical protein